jgi:hypothetical protein
VERPRDITDKSFGKWAIASGVSDRSEAGILKSETQGDGRKNDTPLGCSALLTAKQARVALSFLPWQIEPLHVLSHYL